jgi:Secretion system C-terminal sorting domain
MRAIFTLICILVQMVGYNQVMWRSLGKSDFDHPSCGRTNESRLVVKNGHVYLMNLEAGQQNQQAQFILAKYINNEWQHIDTGVYTTDQLGEAFEFALDNNETPYLFLNDPLNGDKPTLKKFDGSNWVDVGGAPLGTSESYVIKMAMGSDNLPVVMFRENAQTKVKRFDGTNWITLSSSDLDGVGTYLKLDHDNVPYCCYTADGGTFVKKFNGTGWEEVGITSFSGEAMGFAIDNDNQPCLLTIVSNPSLRTMRKFDGISWQTMSMPSNYASYEMSLAFDSENTLYASYASTTPLGHEIKKYVNEVWQSVSLIGSYGPIQTALDGTSLYYQATLSSYLLIVGKKLATGYEYYDSPSDITTGATSADLLLKADGSKFVSFREATLSGNMAIKQYTNNAWNYYDGLMSISEGAVRSPKIIQDNNQYVTVAYIDSGTSSVRVKKNTGSWETLGGTNFSLEAGSYLAFNVNHANVPYVGYKSGRVQKFVANSWEFVGSSAYSGDKAVELAFDNSDQPYMIYDGVSVKKLNGNLWEEMGSADLAAYPNATLPKILCDTNNNLIIAFMDFAKNIHVMQWNGSNWITVGPTIQTNGGCSTLSLKVDAANSIYVLYNRLSNNFRNKANLLKFNGSNWEVFGTPDFSAGEIYSADLEFAANGVPYVVYSSPYGAYCKYFADENGQLGTNKPNKIAQESMVIWPNPATSKISVSTTAKISNIEVFDLTGKKVLSSKSNEIDIAALQKGLYLIKANTQNGSQTQKFVKN